MKQRILFALLGILFFNLAFGQTGKIPDPTQKKELVAILDTIHQEDQKYREGLDTIYKKYGWDSKETKDVWKIINAKDSINLIKIEKILAEYGWLGAEVGLEPIAEYLKIFDVTWDVEKFKKRMEEYDAKKKK